MRAGPVRQSHALALPTLPMPPDHQAATQTPSARLHPCATRTSGAPAPRTLHMLHYWRLGGAWAREWGTTAGWGPRSRGKVRKRPGAKAPPARLRGCGSRAQSRGMTMAEGPERPPPPRPVLCTLGHSGGKPGCAETGAASIRIGFGCKAQNTKQHRTEHTGICFLKPKKLKSRPRRAGGSAPQGRQRSGLLPPLAFHSS